MFSHIQSMRVVPFDLQSVSQLIGSSMGSITVLLPLLHVDGHVAGFFDTAGEVLGHFGGH